MYIFVPNRFSVKFLFSKFKGLMMLLNEIMSYALLSQLKSMALYCNGPSLKIFQKDDKEKL